MTVLRCRQATTDIDVEMAQCLHSDIDDAADDHGRVGDAVAMAARR